MKDIVNKAYGVSTTNEFLEIAERAGVREGDKDTVAIVNAALQAVNASEINKSELLLIAYASGYLQSFNDSFNEEPMTLIEFFSD